MKSGLDGLAASATAQASGLHWRMHAGVDAAGDAITIKEHDAGITNARAVAWCHRELEMLRVLAGTSTPRAIGLTVRDGRPGLVLEDLSGYRSVAHITRASGPWPLERFLGVAANIACAVGELHQRDVIHKALRPEHVLIGPDDRVFLIGLEQATRMAEEDSRPVAGVADAAVVAYASPEQTGRMNRPVDYRTDLYSLGLIYYEMLTGTPPFAASDLVGVIHAHIAMVPPPLRSTRPTLPAALDAIVSRLLAKSPDARYQNAFALADDLTRAATASEDGVENTTEGVGGAHGLGGADRSTSFALSQRLYGREAAAAELIACFERVAQGGRALACVAGYSGVGKTALVNEIQRPLAERNGSFASGKFDQLGQITPLSALRRALGELVTSIAAEQPQRRAQLAADLEAELGSSVAVLLDVIPELALVVSMPIATLDLAAAEADHRFRLAFRKLIEVLARRDPLVLSLDDLQWVDAASLRLLEDLATATEIDHLLIVITYRDNEVDEGHPLARALRRLTEAGAPSMTIELLPLTEAHVTALVADSFGGDAEFVRRLAAHVHGHTGGNPFFVRRLLGSLHDERQLRFDFKGQRWVCDFEAIDRFEVAPNVVELMVRQLRRLDADTVATLELAACIGGAFDLATLAGLAGKPPYVVGEHLWVAARAGMVALVDGREWTELGVAGRQFVDEHASSIVYRFRHDRVQQAAYSLIAPARLPAIHLALCRLLRAAGAWQTRVFEAAGHCVRALEEIQDRDELIEVVRVVLNAAARAININAASAAEAYSRAVQSTLGNDDEVGDEHRVELRLEAQKLVGESQMLRGDFEGARATFAAALARPLPKLARVALLTLTMETSVSEGQLGVALATLVQILATLGIELDQSTVQETAASASERIVRARRGRSAQEIVDGPEATDPEVVALLDVLARAADTAYMSGRDWIVALGAVGVTAVLDHGNTLAASMIFSSYAVADGEPTTTEGFARRAEYGRIGTMLADRYGVAAWIARANVSNAPHFDRSFRDAVTRFDLAAATGWESSALTWASYAEVRALFTMLVAGVALDRIDSERAQRVVRIRRANRSVSSVCCDALEHFVHALRAPTETPWLLGGNAAGAAELEGRLARSGPWATCKALSLQQLLAVIYERWPEAGTAAQAMVPIGHALHGMSNEHWFHVFEGLAQVNSLDQQDPSAASEVRARLAAVEHLIAVRITSNPEYYPSLCVARALRARVDRDPHRAISELNRAIVGARDADQTALVALAAEEAFRVASQCRWETLALHYLQEAHTAYVAWGAHEKARALVARDPTRLVAGVSGVDAIAVADVESLLKSVRAISGELQLHDLLRRLMQIVLENAGAQRGSIVLERDGALVVEAASVVRERAIETVLVARRLEDGDVASQLVQHVFKSGETVVLDDLQRESRFGLGRLTATQRPRSTLTMPIESQGRRIGALHLESWATTHAFRAGARRALWLLLNQAVTAIENARLYGSVEREIEVRARTELALRAERDFTARVFENLPLLACGVDGDGTLVFANPAVERTLGRPNRDLVGRSWWETMHDRSAQRDALREQLGRAGHVRAWETTLRDAADHEHVISWTCVPSNDDGAGRSQMLCFGADVTDERQRDRDREMLETQLRRSQQLETVGTLALGIAHDINNILTPIAAYSELLAHDLPTETDAHAFVVEIQRAGARAAELVGRILAASRKVEQARRPVLVQGVAREVCRLLSASLGAKVELRMDIDPNCPPVQSDPGQLHQALLNLGTNAGHAMRPKGGVLAVRVARAIMPPSSPRAGQPCVVLVVADNGHGMDAETQGRIFDPFFTTKPVGEGTGLGLWVVHGVVENSGGHITVDSEVGVGTTFSLFFPVEVVTTSVAPAAATAADVRGRERVLVLDDEPAIARVLGRALTRLGYQVTTFERSRDAIAAVRAHPDGYDIVVTDLTMPEVDGLEVASEVHAIRADLPIILASGIGSDQSALALSARGIRATLQKPLQIAALGAALRRALGDPDDQTH